MNKTNLQHAVIGLLMHNAIGLTTGNWWAGYAAAVSFFLAREHAQREYKIYTWGQKTGRRWWKGFTGWSRDNWWDFLAPLLTCSAWMAMLIFFG